MVLKVIKSWINLIEDWKQWAAFWWAVVSMSRCYIWNEHSHAALADCAEKEWMNNSQATRGSVKRVLWSPSWLISLGSDVFFVPLLQYIITMAMNLNARWCVESQQLGFIPHSTGWVCRSLEWTVMSTEQTKGFCMEAERNARTLPSLIVILKIKAVDMA